MNGIETYVDTNELLPVEQKRLYETVKRIQDFTMALMTLLLLLPLWLLFALVIKLSSPGPVIDERKEALGRYGRRISMYKFRTTYVIKDNSNHKNTSANYIQGKYLDSIQKSGKRMRVYNITRESKVTPVGRFLRKSGLDEIPQLVNVLRGELAIVGPRPPLFCENEHHAHKHSRRLEVLPGLTGLYQVTARGHLPFEKMVEIDMDYIRRRSFWLDLKIILMTPWVLITRKDAH